MKLPKHGLVMKSPPLPIAPSVQISNARWDKSEIRRGESVKLTADVKGAPEGVELLVEIFEYDANGAHELVTKFKAPTMNKKLETEWEYQHPGNTKDIPPAHETEKGYEFPEYFFRVTVAGISADSGRLRFKDWVEIELRDRRGILWVVFSIFCILLTGVKKKGILSAEGTASEHGIPPGPFKVDFPDINGPVAVAEDEG